MKDFSPVPSGRLGADIKDRIRGKAAIVGIGNILRGDDALGPKLIELLKERRLDAALFDCGTAPENYIIPILSSSCETVIFVDATDFHQPPGSVKIFDEGNISNVSFSTHSPSPRLFIDLLRTGRDNLNIFIVSVQPKTTKLGELMSQEVREGLAGLAGAFEEALAP